MVVVCLADGCAEQLDDDCSTPLCKPHDIALEAAMVAAMPLLLGVMPVAQAEVEAWFASDWAPRCQWVLAEEESYEVAPLPDVVASMMMDLAQSWRLAWIDPSYHVRRDASYAKRGETAPPVTGWLVPDDGATADAWQAHLTPILTEAVRTALRTFSTRYAGNEVRAALRGESDYGPAGLEGAIEEVCNRPRASAVLSDEADFFLRVRYDDDPSYLAHVGECDDWWFAQPVLSADQQALLQRVRDWEVAQHPNSHVACP